MAKQKYIIGSVSSGTMRPEDLIPAFVSVLEDLIQTDDENDTRTIAHSELLVKEIKWRIELDDYYGSDEAGYDLEELFDLLQEYAPPYFYFGSHPADGADYGFWLWDEDIAQQVKDNGGIVVSDLSELDDETDGGVVEVLHINDHGNMSLYSYDADTKTLEELWAIV